MVLSLWARWNEETHRNECSVEEEEAFMLLEISIVFLHVVLRSSISLIEMHVMLVLTSVVWTHPIIAPVDGHGKGRRLRRITSHISSRSIATDKGSYLVEMGQDEFAQLWIFVEEIIGDMSQRNG